MARIIREKKRYPSHLTDEEGEHIAARMLQSGRTGIHAMGYLVRSDCGQQGPSIHFGHWRTIYISFRELARHFLFQTIHGVELIPAPKEGV